MPKVLTPQRRSQDSNPGSRSRESEALPLRHGALHLQCVYQRLSRFIVNVSKLIHTPVPALLTGCLQPDRRIVQVDHAQDSRRVNLVLEDRLGDDDAGLVRGERQMDSAEEARLRGEVGEARTADENVRRLVADDEDGRLIEATVPHDHLRLGARDVGQVVVVADAGRVTDVLADPRRVGDVDGDGATAGQRDDARRPERAVGGREGAVGHQHRPALHLHVLQPRTASGRTEGM